MRIESLAAVAAGMGTDRADRRASRSTADVDAVATRDHTSHGFAGFGINGERLVIHALRNLEPADWLAWVGRFVDVSGHARIYNGSSQYAGSFKAVGEMGSV